MWRPIQINTVIFCRDIGTHSNTPIFRRYWCTCIIINSIIPVVNAGWMFECPSEFVVIYVYSIITTVFDLQVVMTTAAAVTDEVTGKRQS